MKCTVQIVATLYFCAVSGVAHSGPDEVTESLMHEYVSLLDWGVFNMNRQLDGKEGRPGAWVYFDFDSNTITIESYNRLGEIGQNARKLQENCRTWIEQVRRFGGIDPASGKPNLGSVSYYADQFTHSGYILGEIESSADRLKELDKKFRLRFLVKTQDFVEIYECTTPLLSIGFSSRDLRP